MNINYDVVRAITNDRVGIMPDASQVHFKLIYEVPTGKVLGAQAIGKGDVVKRVDVIATVIKLAGTVEVPEKTEKYKGFYNLTDIEATVENTTLSYIIRGFFEDTFEERKNKVREIAKELNKRYGEDTVVLEIKNQYNNMKEKIGPVMHIVENAKEAMIEAKVTPNIKPIRGGTESFFL